MCKGRAAGGSCGWSRGSKGERRGRGEQGVDGAGSAGSCGPLEDLGLYPKEVGALEGCGQNRDET